MKEKFVALALLLAAILLSASARVSHAEVRIADDPGGRMGTYIDRYRDLRTSGESVIIDGLCASACTMVLSAIPYDKICVTPRAILGFHAAWDADANGHEITNRGATQALFSMYPPRVRRWIAARGGLTSQRIYLRGKQLMSLYHPCFLDARASAQR